MNTARGGVADKWGRRVGGALTYVSTGGGSLWQENGERLRRTQLKKIKGAN